MLITGEQPAELARGWPVLLSTLAGNGAGLAALPFYALSSFIVPLQQAFGWSRPAIGLAATVLAGGTFVMAGITGRLCDRFGARRVAMLSILLYAADLALMSRTGPDIRRFYAGFAVLALVGGATTSIAYARIVSVWFERRRGLALGIMASGGGVSALLVPTLLNHVIGDYGWRSAWLVCGAIAILPLPLLLALVPTGRRRAGVHQEGGGCGMRDALRSRAFWFMGAAIALSISAASGLVVHLKPLLQDQGATASLASEIAGLLGAGMLLGRLGAGYLLDRVNGASLAACIMLMSATGFALLATGLPGTAAAGVCLIGLTLGAEGDLLAFLTARWFGLRSYSEIFGWLFGIMSFGSATGPAIAGLLYRMNGGYRTALLVFAAQCTLASAAFLSLRNWRPAAEAPLRRLAAAATGEVW